MEEKQICCCGSSTWTRVIGWFQLVCSVIGIIVVAMLFAGALTVTPDDYEKASGSPITPEDREKIEIILTATSVTLGFYLVILVVSFIMSIILLKGSYNRNPRLLHAWIIVTVIFLVLTLINSVAKCFISTDGASLGSAIMSIILTLLIQGFFVWVVNTHRKEIQIGQPVFPVKA